MGIIGRVLAEDPAYSASYEVKHQAIVLHCFTQQPEKKKK